VSDENSAQLARIEGKIDLQNEKLETANKINEERHQVMKADVLDLRQAHHRISNRVQILEADKNRTEGKMQGVAVSTKLAWSLASLIVGSGGVLAIMELLK
jgi:hypothetical protein